MPDTAAPRTEPALDQRTSADTSPELATTALWRAAIGTLQTDYYLRHFTAFDERERTTPRWNSAAALCTLNWMVLRRMWSAALAYTGLVLTLVLGVFGIGKLVFHYGGEVEAALAVLLGALWIVVPGLWGNTWLYKHLRHDMALAVGTQAQLEQAQATLLARAPTRQRLYAVLAVNAALASLLAALLVGGASLDGVPSTLSQGAKAAGDAPSQSAAPSTRSSAAIPGDPTLASSKDPAAPPSTAASSPAAAAPALANAAAPARSLTAGATTTPQAARPADASSAPLSATAVPQTAGPAGTSSSTAAAPVASASAAVNAAMAPTTLTQARPPTKELRPGSARTPSALQNTPASTASPETATPATGSTKAPNTAQVKAPAPRSPNTANHRTTASTTAQGTPSPAAASASPPAKTKTTGHGVNVGLFANPDNARRASDTLRGAGLPVNQQAVKTPKGLLQRVRVGPFDNATAAQAAAERVRALGLDAQVYSPKP